MGKRTVLIIGGQFAGNFTARDLKGHFDVTVVDAKEYFEYTPGILRAYVKPAHFDALTFTLEPVYSRKMGVKFVWGEVTKLMADGEKITATIKAMFLSDPYDMNPDYCMICAGCNFGVLDASGRPSKTGESLWFPVVHERNMAQSDWAHIDERYIEGRRRHILEEYHSIEALAKQEANLVVVGAGFIGVEWVTELEYYFPRLETFICDMLPNCLGPLPPIAARYCSDYMHAVGVTQAYSRMYVPFGDTEGKHFTGQDKKVLHDKLWVNQPGDPDKEGLGGFGLPNGADKIYVCMGTKASNYFMPENTLMKGTGYITVNAAMQVVQDNNINRGDQLGTVWGGGNVFAVGDCNTAFFGIPTYETTANGQFIEITKEMLDKEKKDHEEAQNKKDPADRVPYRNPPWRVPGNHERKDPKHWALQSTPKISYPGEEQAMHAIWNLEYIDAAKNGWGCWTNALCCGCLCRGPCTCGASKYLRSTWFPWGAGMFATSLGPHDACFVMGANWQPKSGYMVNWWIPAALQKEIIETTKIDECRDRWIGKLIWHFVHHTPCHLWGKGRSCRTGKFMKNPALDQSNKPKGNNSGN